MGNIKRYFAVALAATMALGMASCSKPAAPQQGSSPTLNLALTGAPASLDITQFATGTNTLLMSMIYDRLAYSAPDGTLHPQAATEWAYSSDKSSLTIKLRPNMKFSNGDLVNGNAVKATIERSMAAKDTTNPNMFASIASVNAQDDTTVVLNLKHPDPNLATYLGAQVGLIGDPATFNDTTVATNPVGSGPYTMNNSETIPGTKYVFDKNLSYWDANSISFSKVVVTVITDATATFNALQSGQLDVAPLALDQLDKAKSSALQVTEAPYAQLGALLINDRAGKTIPALGDLRVRQAINMVFDRAAIVKSLNHGVGEAIEQPFQPNSTGYVKSMTDPYTYDVAKAKSLMAEAGYSSGFDVTMPSVVGNTTAYEPTVTQALAQLNIRVKWDAVPFSKIVSMITSGTMPLYYWPIGWNNMPTNIDVLVRPTGFFNAYKSSTPEMETLLANADAAADADAQAAAYQAIGKYLTDQAWFAPLFTWPNLYASSATVTYSPHQIDLTDNIRYYRVKG